MTQNRDALIQSGKFVYCIHRKQYEDEETQGVLSSANA